MVSITDSKDLQGWPILDQESLKTVSQNKDFEADTVFYSSGDEPKQIPYSEKDLQKLFEDIAEALKELGFSEDDRFMALGLGKGNHQSGLGLKMAAEALDATRITDSIEDAYQKDLRELEPTAAASLPKAMLKLGKDLEDRYDEEISEALPAMENIATAGDRLTDRRREQIREMWDTDVGGFYVATEPGVIGVEVENELYEPVSDEIYIEVLEEGAEIDLETGKAPEEKIHGLEDIDEEIRGSLLVSMPERDELPLIRYNLGDKVRAKDGKIKYEGREDEVINMSGHHLYPSDVDKAMENISNKDWYGVLSETEFETVLNIHILGSNADPANVRDEIMDQNEVIKDWYDYGGIQIDAYVAEDIEELEEQFDNYDLNMNPLESMKTRKILRDKSYIG